MTPAKVVTVDGVRVRREVPRVRVEDAPAKPSQSLWRKMVRHSRNCRACTFSEPCRMGRKLRNTWAKAVRREEISAGRCHPRTLYPTAYRALRGDGR